MIYCKFSFEDSSYCVKVAEDSSLARSFIEQPAEYVITFKMDSPQCLHSGLQHEAGVCCFRRSGEGECRGA